MTSPSQTNSRIELFLGTACGVGAFCTHALMTSLSQLKTLRLEPFLGIAYGKDAFYRRSLMTSLSQSPNLRFAPFLGTACSDDALCKHAPMTSRSCLRTVVCGSFFTKFWLILGGAPPSRTPPGRQNAHRCRPTGSQLVFRSIFASFGLLPGPCFQHFVHVLR